MTFVTDFADQAVMLPLIAAMALTLAALGWWRGAAAWLLAVGASFATVLVLKIAFVACGPTLGIPSLRSPSGHTAAAGLLAGGIAAVARSDWRRVAAAASLAALAIGMTRVEVGLHTPADVILGGVIGVAGAAGFRRLAGPAPPMRLRWLYAAIIGLALLLHGRHLNAEPHIRAATASLLICANGAWR